MQLRGDCLGRRRGHRPAAVAGRPRRRGFPHVTADNAGQVSVACDEDWAFALPQLELEGGAGPLHHAGLDKSRVENDLTALLESLVAGKGD